MTPEQWIGHDAFRSIVSHHFPPNDGSCWANWLQHLDGTLVLLTRGVMSHDPDLHRGSYADWAAREAFGEACHCCVKLFADGMIRVHEPNKGEYVPHWSTTDRKPKYNPWGSPCDKCRGRLATEIMEKAAKEAEKFGFCVSWCIERRDEVKP